MGLFVLAGMVLWGMPAELPAGAPEKTAPVPSGTVAEVRIHHGAPTLFINGRPEPQVAHIPIGDFPTEVCREFSDAGVRIYSHIIWNWRDITPGSDEPLAEVNRWWLGPGRYDFAKVDRRLKAVLAADPDAYLFPRVKLNPPDWWLEANPNERTQTEDGQVGPQHSMASRVWEATYERMLRDLVGHIETSDYGHRVIGYHLAGGKSSEWFWWGFDLGWIDYSPAARERFREWMRERYREDESALRAAWRDTDLSFDTVEPPSGALREATEYGYFRDAERARPAIDYFRFLSDVTADNIVRSCRIIKEATGGRKITGAFYGYMLHFAHCRALVCNEGMCGLRRVLESPHVDFLCSPPQYEARRGGDPGLFQSGYFGSYRLHRKLFWQEADIRTHLATGVTPPPHYRAADLPETLGLMHRQAGYALAQMNGLWWFTLAGDDTFGDEAIMNSVSRISGLLRGSLERPRARRHDVAIFADEESYFHMKTGPFGLMYPLVTDMRRMLSRTGVPHDIYLLSDIAHPDLPDYRMYVFLNGFVMSEDTRKAIARKIRRDNAVAVWFYAPGFILEDGSFSEEAIEQLTGIRVRHAREEAVLGLDLTDASHPITSETDIGHVAGTKEPVEPVFYVDDPNTTVLGRLTGTSRAGLAVREFNNWRSVYFAAPAMSPALFRGLARYAGGHVYCTTNDVLDANSRYVMLHTTSPGEKVIRLPGEYEVRDLLHDRVVIRSGDTIRFEATSVGETYLFELSAEGEDR